MIVSVCVCIRSLTFHYYFFIIAKQLSQPANEQTRKVNFERQKKNEERRRQRSVCVYYKFSIWNYVTIQLNIVFVLSLLIFK